jgi:hypothetical protein
MQRCPAPIQGAVAVAGLAGLGVVMSVSQPFVYFQF